MSQEGKFSLKKKTQFSQLASGEITELVESDLCFQDGESIYQFGFHKPEDDRTYEIKPGTFVLAETQGGLILKKIDFKNRELLESVTNTAIIFNEAKVFFSRLHVYEKLNRPKKRGILLYSAPGCGKTSAIEKVCSDLFKEDPGTVVVVWPTSEIEADDINKLLTTGAKYSTECTRMILIIEDIGGGEQERTSRSGVDSGLLNLLDGVGVVFRLPTFIIATTNHPENLLSSLANRPERFDRLIHLKPPSHEEKIALTSFIAKRDLTDEEKESLGSKGSEEFSIAHLAEVVVRSELHDKTIPQVIKELIEHTKLFNKDFEEKSKEMGFGIGRD
jgi:SpoVK/Ycf46/Vps4 family AAA+-type ATPase